MKRFYKAVAVRSVDGAWELLLDERPVKTPARAGLRVPSEALAEAMAEEWRVQGDRIDPRSMPLTGLANAAIDRVGPDRDAFARGLAAYGESDLLCYRAEGPASLAALQSAHWDPILAWARRRFDVDFEVVQGIMPRTQPADALRQLGHAVAAYDAFALAGLSPLVTISGSLVIGLAVAEQAIAPEDGWAAATVDEAYQAEKWGEDADAASVLEARRRDFDGGYRFLELLRRR